MAFIPVTTNSQAVINGIRSFGGWELDESGKEHPVETLERLCHVQL